MIDKEIQISISERSSGWAINYPHIELFPLKKSFFQTGSLSLQEEPWQYHFNFWVLFSFNLRKTSGGIHFVCGTEWPIADGQGGKVASWLEGGDWSTLTNSFGIQPVKTELATILGFNMNYTLPCSDYNWPTLLKWSNKPTTKYTLLIKLLRIKEQTDLKCQNC